MNRKYLATSFLAFAITFTSAGFVWAETPANTGNVNNSITKTESLTIENKKDASVVTTVPTWDNQVVVENATFGDVSFQHIKSTLDLNVGSSKTIRIVPTLANGKKLRSIQIEKKTFIFNPVKNYYMGDNNFSEIIVGTPGSEKIDLGSGNDVVYGCGGDDYFIGGAGSDTFVFNGAFGASTVLDSAFGIYNSMDENVVVFGDLKSTDVKFIKNNTSLIIKSISTESNSVTVAGFFASNNTIHFAEFKDVTLSAAQLAEKAK